MTQWILIVVMSSSASIGINFWRQPAITTATFTDQSACEQAGKAAIKLAGMVRLDSPTVVYTCAPASTEPGK
jgi:hypothetical protein